MQEAEAAPTPTENLGASLSGERSIFDRIGGEISVHGATSLLSSRMLEDPQLSGAVSADNMDAIISAFVGLLTKQLGGPDTSFPGSTVEDALSSAGASGANLSVVVHHLRSALEVMEMPSELVEEILATL